MNVDSGLSQVLLSRARMLCGHVVVSVRGEDDTTGDAWTVLTLDTGDEVHIRDNEPWVLCHARPS